MRKSGFLMLKALKSAPHPNDNYIYVQLGLHKRRLWYNFSSYVGSMRLIPQNFRSAALSTATQPW